MPRINRAIELLEQGQPIYYTGPSHLSYEGGVASAQTWADYIIIDMEHGMYNLPAIEAFMKGLTDGGPTRSGHRTPTVITTLPTDGTDGTVMLSNDWMVKQVLAQGVHGILLCHARTPEAVRVFVESARFPFHTIGVGDVTGEGQRGGGGQGLAAASWGISSDEYLQKADVWPLNPEGEIMLGLKIEDRYGLVNAEANLQIPGIAFAEWGPGDMGISFGYPNQHDPPYPPEMDAARAAVLNACLTNNVAFLNSVSSDDVIDMIAEGVRVGGGSQEAAEIGRRHTSRTMPW